MSLHDIWEDGKSNFRDVKFSRKVKFSWEVIFCRKSHFLGSQISQEVKFPGESNFLGSQIYREVKVSLEVKFSLKSKITGKSKFSRKSIFWVVIFLESQIFLENKIFLGSHISQEVTFPGKSLEIYKAKVCTPAQMKYQKNLRVTEKLKKRLL